MTDWRAIALLPNLDVADAVEGDALALVGQEETRVRALRRASRNLDRLLSRFTDAFGVSIRPAVLLQPADAPVWTRNIDAIASFRDAVAIATVTYARALELNHPRGHRITFSNWFWLYPWMLDRNDEHLIASTPAMHALHDASRFRGQSAPELSPMTLSSQDLDEPLLEALLARWRRRYAARRPSWPDRALFRSLNMAQQAAQTPAGIDTTFYDVGRMIALWVSAFEILAHPGDGKSGLSVVYDLLDRSNGFRADLQRGGTRRTPPERVHRDARAPAGSMASSTGCVMASSTAMKLALRGSNCLEGATYSSSQRPCTGLP